MTALPETEEIRRLVGRVNDAWLKGSSNEIAATLDPLFAEEMVICGPNLQEAAGGKEACVKSYVAFASHAVVKRCTLSEPAIHQAGETAIATYSWDMTYTINDQEYSETGHDVFVLNRSQGQWRVVWRMMLPSAARGE